VAPGAEHGVLVQLSMSRRELRALPIDVAEATSHNQCSMYRALSEGKVTEIHAINAAVASVGAKLGVPSPVNETLAKLISGISDLRMKQEPIARPSAVQLVTVDQVRAWVRQQRRNGFKIGFVPTMGALHDGHLSLVSALRDAGCDVVIASVFVNPKQFGPTEDLDIYPRDPDGDCRKLEAAGADAVWLPTVNDIYPDDFTTEVKVMGPLTQHLCGASRPQFFQGITTVVTKLLCTIAPDAAAFGEKDFQQLAVIRQLVKDLGLGVDIVGVPIHREADGLAMSSRNLRLSPADRRQAPMLFRALEAARKSFQSGEQRPGELEETVRQTVLAGTNMRVDYISVRPPLPLASHRSRQ